MPDASCRAQKFETLAWAVRAEADRAAHARDVRDGAAEEDAVASATEIFERLEQLLGAARHPEPNHAHVAHAAAEAARARGSADVARWREAVAALEPFQRRTAADARWRLAEALLQSAAPSEEPAAVLREAADAARVLGDVVLLQETQALARRARITLDVEKVLDDAPTATDDVAKLGLTPRETEVLRLIADGLTNREIGARLFITEKTASVHVSRILSKVDARSRVEAAGVAHRLGLLSESADAPV
jgi:DNA-binding CsgD family transcriptional regulator